MGKERSNVWLANIHGEKKARPAITSNGRGKWPRERPFFAESCEVKRVRERVIMTSMSMHFIAGLGCWNSSSAAARHELQAKRDIDTKSAHMTTHCPF